MAMGRGRALILFFLITAICSASVVEKLSVQGLSQKSDLIGIGRVVKMETILESGEPWTITTVTLEKQLKGQRESTVQIRLPGGYQKVGNRTLVTQVEGVPLPNVNERAVIFLSGKEKSNLALTGLGQGYWKIDIDSEGKEVARKSDSRDGARMNLERLVSEVQRTVRDSKPR
jgi:hypothetical protein